MRWQFLHTFADAFQGCYKNGTYSTCDYRYFAGLYLFFRIVMWGTFISLILYNCGVKNRKHITLHNDVMLSNFDDCVAAAMAIFAIDG